MLHRACRGKEGNIMLNARVFPEPGELPHEPFGICVAWFCHHPYRLCRNTDRRTQTLKKRSRPDLVGWLILAIEAACTWPESTGSPPF
jgi:hypothetical protein